MDKKKLYNTIIKKCANVVKDSLNEEFNHYTAGKYVSKEDKYLNWLDINHKYLEKYLKDNLRISINKNNKANLVDVKLILNDKEIASDYYYF